MYYPLHDHTCRFPLEKPGTNPAAAERADSLIPGVRYWDVNWKKGGLQERRSVLLKENNFYNQLYCGCEFSMGHLSDKQKIIILK